MVPVRATPLRAGARLSVQPYTLGLTNSQPASVKGRYSESIRVSMVWPQTSCDLSFTSPDPVFEKDITLTSLRSLITPRNAIADVVQTKALRRRVDLQSLLAGR